MRYQPTPSGNDVAFAESDVLALATSDTDEVIVAAVAGEFGACDVWFSGPVDWLSASPSVVVRLYARHGSARGKVGETNLADVQHSEDRNSNSSGWVFSARGVEASGYEVSCQRTSGGVNLSGAQFFVHARASSSVPSVLAAGGLSGLRSVSVSNVVQVQPTGTVTVTQSQASALSATVVQSSAALLQATAAQGAAAAASARWPVYLSDGSAAIGTNANPLYAARIRDSAPTFALGTAPISTVTAVGTKSIAYLWHPNSSTKRAEIRRIVIGYLAGAGSGSPLVVVFRVVRITAQNGAPGGTTMSASALDSSDSSSLTVIAGATGNPTRPSSSTQGDLLSLSVNATTNGSYEWRASQDAKPLVLRAGVSEGIEVYADVKNTLTTAMQATVTFEWVEV